MTGRNKRQTPDAFWARVDMSEDCWLWTGARSSSGYGSVGWHGKVYVAHRVAAWLAGMVESPAAPPKNANTFVLHKCDARLCCNPAHFFVGSYSDNNKDAYAKGRKSQPRGSAHANAKLTPEQVSSIIYEHNHGETAVAIAKQLNVSETTVLNVIKGRRYVER